MYLYYLDCVGRMLPRHILILDGPTMYATALMWVGHLFKFLLITPGAKIINVFRAWIGAQLTICAQK